MRVRVYGERVRNKEEIKVFEMFANIRRETWGAKGNVENGI